MNTANVDLNLLHVVRVLLEERSATRAATRLHVTQSAVSNALRRARELFRDELVLRTGRGFVPTPRGAALLPELQVILGNLERAIGSDAPFSPEASERRFTISCADSLCTTFVPRLMALFERRLPRARLCIKTIEDLIDKGYERGGIDLHVGAPPTIPSDCDSEPLFEDPTVIIVRSEHPIVYRRLSLEAYARLSHLEIELGGWRDTAIDHALAERGLRRHVALTVPYFLAVPAIVAGSDLVATTTQSIATTFSKQLGLRFLKPPLELPSVMVQQVWHRNVTLDPGVRFLRTLVHEARPELPAKRAPLRARTARSRRTRSRP